MRNTLSRRAILKSIAALGGAFGLPIAGFAPAIAPTSALAAGIHKNVSYGANHLDIHLPKNPQEAPVIAYVHGGAWKLGNKTRVGAKADYYTARGYVFVSIGYTLYPKANAEQQAVQVSQAVNWIRTNIGAYGGDGARVALMGHSAGCHLASMATLSGACTPKLLICNDTGAYDLAYLAEINKGRLPRLYSALNRKAKWVRWSPISYIRNRRQPPALVLWSGGRNRDRISKRFAAALEAAGNSVTRFAGESYGHVSINAQIGKNAGNPVTRAIDRFLERL